MAKRRAPETKIFPTMSAFLAQDDRKSSTHFFVALKSSEQKHLASLTAFFAGMSDGKTFSSPLQVDPSLKRRYIILNQPLSIASAALIT